MHFLLCAVSCASRGWDTDKVLGCLVKMPEMFYCTSMLGNTVFIKRFEAHFHQQGDTEFTFHS